MRNREISSEILLKTFRYETGRYLDLKAQEGFLLVLRLAANYQTDI